MNWLFFFFSGMLSASVSAFLSLLIFIPWPSSFRLLVLKTSKPLLGFCNYIQKESSPYCFSAIYVWHFSIHSFFFCILLSLSFIISPLTPRVLWGLTEEPFLNQRWINNIRILYDCLGMSVMCSEQRKIQGSSCLIKSSSIKIGKPNICSTNRLYLLPLACAIQ